MTKMRKAAVGLAITGLLIVPSMGAGGSCNWDCAVSETSATCYESTEQTDFGFCFSYGGTLPNGDEVVGCTLDTGACSGWLYPIA